MTTLQQKINISILSGAILTLISLPSTYRFTNSILTKSSNAIFNPATGCKTAVGHLVHTLVFFLVIFGIMFIKKRRTDEDDISIGLKAKYSFYGALIFFLLTSNTMYRVTGGIFNQIADSNGCPTKTGVMIHSLVYICILVAVMYFPDKKN